MAENRIIKAKPLNHAVRVSGERVKARKWWPSWETSQNKTMTESNAVPIQSPLTRETLTQMFIQVDSDPLAGKGCLSKRDILIDRIIAHCRVAVIQPAPVEAAPLLLEIKDGAK
jgi:hypothetical protein